MAFPEVTAALEAWSNTNKPPTGWATGTGYADFTANTGGIVASVSAESEVDYKTSGSYGPDVCFYFPLNVGSGADIDGCFYRVTDAPTIATGYRILYRKDVDDKLHLYRMDTGADLGSSSAITWTAGDFLGVEAIGTAHKFYTCPAASDPTNPANWTLQLSVTDATFGSAGSFAIYLKGNAPATTIGVVHGGTISSGTSFTPPTGVMEMRGEILSEWTEANAAVEASDSIPTLVAVIYP